MDPPSPSSPGPVRGQPRTLADLSTDAFAHCTRFLGLRDVSNLAVASKSLLHHAYSDAVWTHLLQDRWTNYCLSSGGDGAREEYIGRHTALQQLKFRDPMVSHLWAVPAPPSQILLAKNDIYVSQGPQAIRFQYSSSARDSGSREVLRGHNARITCMRLFPISEMSFYRSEMQLEDTILATSSSDRTIRFWWKGHSQRCFKGHSGPVTALADTLLGDSGSKLLASGGEDCTVRLWSISSGRKHHHLAMTYHGHEKSISFLSVARHKACLLVSLSKDSRVRIWDTTSTSSSGASSCVGMTAVTGPPVGMKCHDAVCYIAAGTTVTAIDLRTMRSIATVAIQSPKIHSFEMLPSKWLLCTGGEEKAMLWDIRKNQAKPEPVAELEGHAGPVKFLHMDSYKVVTGGPYDSSVNVWETDTGNLANSLDCFDTVAAEIPNKKEFSAMAVDGCRLVTSLGSLGMITVRDFSQCSIPLLSSSCSNISSKFWEAQHCSND